MKKIKTPFFSKMKCYLEKNIRTESPKKRKTLLYNKTVINTYENRNNFQLKKKKDYFIFIIQR